MKEAIIWQKQKQKPGDVIGKGDGISKYDAREWLMCKLTVTQRTIESKTNMQYIFKIICILHSLYTGMKILKG
jgi:hypothetical protein